MDIDTTIAGSKSEQKLLSFSTPYGLFSLVLLAITIVSLIPQFFAGFLADPVEHSPQLIVHGVVFLGWYLLFSVQAGLVPARNVAVHRKMGYASIPFAVFLVISGALMLTGTMQSYQADWSEQYLLSRTSFVWAIFHTLVSFTLFYALAVMYRRQSQIHKRLMLLASLSMMAASITRFAYLPFIPIDGTAFTLLLTYVLLATPLVIDRVQDSRIHPALLYGTLVYVVTQFVCMGMMPDYGHWQKPCVSVLNAHQISACMVSAGNCRNRQRRSAAKHLR